MSRQGRVPVYPIQVGRSDGVLEIVDARTKRIIQNMPKSLQKEPDRWRELQWDDVKSKRYRRRLGQLLGNELGSVEQKKKQWTLNDLPTNYRLFEYTREKGQTDMFVYGYPGDKVKPFRSIKEFYRHLLWLATEPYDDPDDRGACTCPLCCPDEFQQLYDDMVENQDKVKKQAEMASAENGTSIKQERITNKSLSNETKKAVSMGREESKPMVKREKTSATSSETSVKKGASMSAKSTIGTNPMVIIPKRSTSRETSTKPPSKSSTPRILSPTPLQRPQNFEQFHDTQEKTYVYRLGEVVWFARDTAFGLALVQQRYMVKDQRNQSHAQYEVQPLSHPLFHPSVLRIDQQSQLKPFLAYSPPPTTHEGLRDAQFTYTTVDWAAVIAGRYGQGVPEVDGSIFAARAADASYTPVQSLQVADAGPGETHYSGIYFGSEKIWVGDAIRLHGIAAGIERIMVVHHIIETLTPSSTNSIVHLIGDVYTFSMITVPPNGQYPVITHLPFRVQKDLEYRNRLSARAKNQVCAWHLVEVRSQLGLREIKGRWYEASLLQPILEAPDDFAKAVTNGDIPEIGSRLNPRGNGTVLEGLPEVRKADRLEIFAGAVPRTTRINRDPQDEPNSNLDPALTAQPAPQLQRQRSLTQQPQNQQMQRQLSQTQQTQPQQMQRQHSQSQLSQYQQSHGGENDDAVAQFMDFS